MRVTQTSWFPLYAISLDEHSNRYALLNIENILIVQSIRSSLLFFAVAMKVEQVNVIKRFHQTLPHAAEGWIIQIAVVADEREDAVASLLDAPLTKPNKLNVIVVEPVRIL